MEEPTRQHEDYAVPTAFFVGTGQVGVHEVIILDLTLVVPMAPEIGEQRAVLALYPADAAMLANAITEASAGLTINPEAAASEQEN